MLQQFVQSVIGPLQGEVVAIDGKTLRRSGESAGKKALHLVSAWATQQGVVLGQVRTPDHSNEITAIPVLLQMLDVRGATVTIDAMGCQKEIARQVRQQGADYVLAVKDNQEKLRWTPFTGPFSHQNKLHLTNEPGGCNGRKHPPRG